MNDTKRVYLDYAAATPLLPVAFEAMEPFLKNEYGNASAIHAEGLVAKQAVEGARSAIAGAVQVRPEYVTFTGGGTEGNNLAIFGVVETARRAGREYSQMEVLTTSIEHPSVGVAMERLQELGVAVRYVEVDAVGKIVLSDLKLKLSDKTIIVSCAYANSEIGTVQPLHAIKKALTEAEQTHGSDIYFHVDAAQAPLWLTCQFATTGADMLVLDFAKCNGPKGVGALVRSRRVKLSATSYGGGQESGLRPGTENVPGIVGAGVAFVAAQTQWKERAQTVALVRDAGIQLLVEKIAGCVLNGAVGEGRLANNINISIPGLDTEFAAVVLDRKGFAVSTKSACAGAGSGLSTVVQEITGDSKRAGSTLRFSLSPQTTVDDIELLSTHLSEHVAKMQSYLS